jgi:CDP-6-deoxy-D-xylo-4-hexulose-3-dehydrase
MYWPLMKDVFSESDRLELVKFILNTDFYTNGKKVKEFEQAWSKWLGCDYSLFVTSGSTANSLLVSAVKELFKIPDGSKVLVPTCTWVTNISPVIQNNLEPVFCDINLENFSFDVSKLPPDDDIKIVFVTYLLGFNAPIEQFKEIYPNAIFIEDICEAHGVTDKYGTKRGTQTTGSTFSFYYGHHMSTIEGGMVCTNNRDLYELMNVKRSHGMARNLSQEYFEKEKEKNPDIDSRFLFITDGYNFRNTELNAVLGLCQLKKLDENIKIRKKNFKIFVEFLKEFSDHFYVPDSQETENSNFCLPFICKKQKLMKIFKTEFDNHEIENRPIVAGNLLLHPFLNKWKDKFDTENANILNYNGVYIGNGPFVTNDMLMMLKNIMINVINNASGSDISG